MREIGSPSLEDAVAYLELAGASWFGGNLNYVNGKYEFADTEFFNILGPNGRVVARVAGVEHSGTGGSNITFTFGACQSPQN